MNGMLMDELNRKVYGCMVRSKIAAGGCSPMRADTMGGEGYCGNYVGLFMFRLH